MCLSEDGYSSLSSLLSLAKACFAIFSLDFNNTYIISFDFSKTETPKVLG